MTAGERGEWRVAAGVAAIVLLGGCQPALIPPVAQHEHRMRFAAPGFSRELVPFGGVGVLPFAGGAGPEGIRNDGAFELAQAYRRAFPKATVLNKDELLSRLRAAGLDKSAVQLIKAYEDTQKLDPALLIRMEKAVPVRYLAYGRLERFSERDVAGQRRKEVEYYSELWDLVCKTVVWSGSANHRVSDSLQQEATPMGDLFVGAATDVVAAIGPTAGKKPDGPAPCAAPPAGQGP